MAGEVGRLQKKSFIALDACLGVIGFTDRATVNATFAGATSVIGHCSLRTYVQASDSKEVLERLILQTLDAFRNTVSAPLAVGLFSIALLAEPGNVRGSFRTLSNAPVLVQTSQWFRILIIHFNV